jgi:phage gp46-like protein
VINWISCTKRGLLGPSGSVIGITGVLVTGLSSINKSQKVWRFIQFLPTLFFKGRSASVPSPIILIAYSWWGDNATETFMGKALRLLNLQKDISDYSWAYWQLW